jgi:hypothetical protein
MNRACGNCDFWEAINEQPGGKGICRREPPISKNKQEGVFTAIWPVSHKTDWCGEFEPRYEEEDADAEPVVPEAAAAS